MDLEWDVNEPPRTTSTPTVTTFSVLMSELILHIICKASWLWPATLDQEVSAAAMSLGKAVRLHVHSLDPGVNGYSTWLDSGMLLVFE